MASPTSGVRRDECRGRPRLLAEGSGLKGCPVPQGGQGSRQRTWACSWWAQGAAWCWKSAFYPPPAWKVAIIGRTSRRPCITLFSAFIEYIFETSEGGFVLVACAGDCRRCMFQLDRTTWIPHGDLVLPGSQTGLLVVALHRPTLCHLSRWFSTLLSPASVPSQSTCRSLALQLK